MGWDGMGLSRWFDTVSLGSEGQTAWDRRSGQADSWWAFEKPAVSMNYMLEYLAKTSQSTCKSLCFSVKGILMKMWVTMECFVWIVTSESVTVIYLK